MSPVTIIWPCQLSVEEYAAAGKEVSVPRQDCPRCGEPTIFWSGYPRSVRAGGEFGIWVRRCRCNRCRCSDALLPSFCLERRFDAVEVIGPAVVALSGGLGCRRVAKEIGGLFAYTTVRGWWRRYRERAGLLLEVLTAATRWCGPRLWGAASTDSLAVLEGVGSTVAVGAGVGLWPAVSLMLGGPWLSATTDVPSIGGVERVLMNVMDSTSSKAPP